MHTERSTLGSFMSLACFQYLRLGVEDITGRVPIIAAGRKRGIDLVSRMGIARSLLSPQQMTTALRDALGIDGTRLCLVESIELLPSGIYEVHITEGACTAGQQAAEPLCAFTMGVFVGALQAIMDMPMRGQEIACTACGSPCCIYQIEPI